MFIKERTENRDVLTRNKAVSQGRIRMDFPNDYAISEDNNLIPNDRRVVNNNRYVNRFENYNIDNNTPNYYNQNQNYYQSQNNSNYHNQCGNNSYYGNDKQRFNDDRNFSDYNEIAFKEKTQKASKSKKKANPKMVIFACVITLLVVLMCTLGALNTVPASAENANGGAIVNTDRLADNVAKDIESTVIPPTSNTNNSANWFDALCDWLTKK